MLYKWRKLRIKWNPLDDPAFYASQIDPRRVYLTTVGGTAADGIYSIDYSLTLPTGTVVSGTVSFNRAAAETNSAINTALMAAFEATAPLDNYLAAAVVATTQGIITRTYLGRELILSNPQAPSGATLRIEGDGFVDAGGEENKLTAQFSTERHHTFGNNGRVGVEYIGVDASGVPTALGTMTCDLQILDVVDRGVRQNPGRAALVGASVVLDDIAPASPEYAELAGSQGCAVRVTNVQNAGAAVGIEIWVKEATI